MTATVHFNNQNPAHQHLQRLLLSIPAVIILLSVFFCPFVSADVVSRKFMLDNGMTVIINEMPSTPQAAIYVWVKTGSASEGKYLNSGISHFIEHMLFKGTARRSTGVIPEEARSMGGMINASTSYDFTDFTLNLPVENFSRGLDLIADMIQNPLFDATELEKERQVIIKEMRMMNDRPERVLDNLVSATVYTLHPYRYPIIGNEEIFQTLTRDNLLEHFYSLYVPNNMIISVSGQFKADDIIGQIRNAFADFKARPFPLRNLPREPEQIFPRVASAVYPTAATRLTLAYQGIPLMDSDLYALDVLAMALGEGESSRFFVELYKNKRLVQSIGATDSTPLDRGYFEIFCLMDTDRSREVLSAVRKIIANVQKNGLRPNELATVKRRVMVENIGSRQTAGGMAYRTAIETAFTGDHLFSEKYLAGVRAVTNNDIKRVARTYLVDQRLSTIILHPLSEEHKTIQNQTQPIAKVNKLVLDNGLRLLLKEDHTLPIVTLRMAIAAGTRQEPQDKAGLSSLTGALWGKAYRGTTAAALSQLVESRGGALNSYSGKNSFMLEMDFLSEDLDLALNILDKLVKTPLFSQDELNLQRSQLLTSIKARRDNPAQMASKLAVETLFLKHPFRNDGLGTEKSLAGITLADVTKYFDRFLDPGHIVISVYGDMNPDTITARLQKSFGNLIPKDTGLKVFDEEEPSAQRIKEITMDKEQAVVMLAMRAPFLNSSDRYGIETAVNILTSSLSGRMFKRIREELGKAYTLGGFYLPGVDAGMVSIYVNTTNENIPKVRSILDEELHRIAVEPVGDKELTDTKTYLISRHSSSLETLAEQAGSGTVNELLDLGFDNDSAYTKMIRAVTADDVRRLALRYLDPARAAIVIVRSNESVK